MSLFNKKTTLANNNTNNIYPEIEKLLPGNQYSPSSKMYDISVDEESETNIGQGSIQKRKPILFRFTDPSNPDIIHDIIHVHSDTSIKCGGFSYWITSTGLRIPPITDLPAYQYYKMDTEYNECLVSININTEDIEPRITPGMAHSRALTYTTNRRISDMVSELSTIRKLFMVWFIIFTILIIAGIIIGIYRHIFI